MNLKQGIFTIILCMVSIFGCAWILALDPKFGNYMSALLVILISMGIAGLIVFSVIGASKFYDWLGEV